MKSFKISILVVLISSVLGSCANENKTNSDSSVKAIGNGSATRERDNCSFQPSNVLERSCYVSYYALLGNPDLYQGRRVFTYAYLTKGSAGAGSGFLLHAENRMRKVNDGASCIRFFDQVNNDDIKLDQVEQKKFYSVALSGVFYKNIDPPCVGILRQVDISELGAE